MRVQLAECEKILKNANITNVEILESGEYPLRLYIYIHTSKFNI